MRIYTTPPGLRILSKLAKLRPSQHASQVEQFSINTNTRWIYDKPNMYKQLDNWAQNIPWIKPYYAVKSNPAPYLIKDIVSHPCMVGLDVASLAEIELARKSTHLANTIYTNPHTINHELANYNIVPINIKVVDSIGELQKMSRINYVPKILIRINGRNLQGDTNFDTKFGASGEETDQLLDFAKRNQIEVCGISFHIGSGGTYNRMEAYKNAYTNAKPYLEKITIQCLPEPTILNFGGGMLPNTDLKEVLGWTKSLPYQMIAEPGRYISEPSHHLFTQVIAVTGRGVYLDNGVYHEMNCYQRDHWKFPELTHEVTTGKRVSSYSVYPPTIEAAIVETTRKMTVFGPTCDSGDTLNHCLLPGNIQAGDWILLPNMGAYTNAGKVDFNGINGASSFTPLHLS